MLPHARKIISTINISAINLALMTTLITGMAQAAERERQLSVEQDVADAQLIRLSVPAGEMEVIGVAGTEVFAEATFVCEEVDQASCNKLLKEVAWSHKDGSIAELSLTPGGASAYNQIKVKVKIGVPRDKNLEVNMGAGELRISDTSACLVAELNAGQINISLEQSQLASASLSAMVGDAKLVNTKGETTSGRRLALVGAQLDWNGGSGSCHTQAKVMAGDAKLTLK